VAHNDGDVACNIEALRNRPSGFRSKGMSTHTGARKPHGRLGAFGRPEAIQKVQGDFDASLEELRVRKFYDLGRCDGARTITKCLKCSLNKRRRDEIVFWSTKISQFDVK
jgi:hypothetical protein